MNYSVTARLGVVSWGCDYQKSQRGLGLAILFCGWPWSEAHLRHIRRAFVVNKMGRTEGSCAESDIESQQPRQNSQIGPSYFAAVPKQAVITSLLVPADETFNGFLFAFWPACLGGLPSAGWLFSCS